MADTLAPADLVAAARVAEAGLRPVTGRDWSARAGPLDWSVEQTITHMIAATAKYTVYLASRCEHFIALSITRWPDATNEEIVDSIVPVATALANVAAVSPPGATGFHDGGPSSAADYHGRACVELLVHTDDALAGLGAGFAPPAELCLRVLAQQFPVNAAADDEPWRRLVTATGRSPR